MKSSLPFSVRSFQYFRATGLYVLCALCGWTFSPGTLASSVPPSPASHPAIQQYLKDGHANEAIAGLKSQLAKNSSDAEAHQLLCRVYIQEEQWPEAEQQCEQAVQLRPNSSTDHLWLGRAYGGQAAHASLTTAYGLARKVRTEFETAVQLDPRNVSALSDLGEFYVDVPRLIGGGVGRADKVAQQLAPLDPSRFHELEAKIDAKNSNFAGAEDQWRQAIHSSPHPADQWMNLAAFYASRKNLPAMVQAIESGAAADPAGGCALVMGATLLIDNHRNLPLAARLLRQYLASSNQSEDFPAFRVRVQLGNLLASTGDRPAAETQYAEARALAGDYAPAQRSPRG
jgi:tetratricopeptide (TPR) repeat protein